MNNRTNIQLMNNRTDIHENKYLSFYEETYLKKNPSHHIEDSPYKFNQLMNVFSVNENYDKILDVGCGLGILLGLFETVVSPTVRVGCDISFNVLKRSKKINSDFIEYIQCDGSTLPFRDSYFDLVIITDLVEHVPNPIKLLTEIRRVSKQLVIIMPMESGLISDIIFRILTIFGFETNVKRLGHIHRFNARECRFILEKSCFRIDNYQIIKANDFQTNMTLLGRLQLSISKKIMRISVNWDMKLIGAYEFIAFCK